MKKLIFLSLFSTLLLANSICHATPYNAIFYETLRLTNINFDDSIKALDFFIAKWKPAKNPTPDAPYEEPKGIAGGDTTSFVYENSKYIAYLILASRRPLVGIKNCHEKNEERLTEQDARILNEAVTSFGQAYDTMREYAIRIYNIRQSYQDLSDLYATRAKILEGQAKLSEILARGGISTEPVQPPQPQKKDSQTSNIPNSNDNFKNVLAAKIAEIELNDLKNKLAEVKRDLTTLSLSPAQMNEILQGLRNCLLKTSAETSQNETKQLVFLQFLEEVIQEFQRQGRHDLVTKILDEIIVPKLDQAGNADAPDPKSYRNTIKIFRKVRDYKDTNDSR